jgi:chromosome segregation ATPase
VKKSYWKQRTYEAIGRADQAEARAEDARNEVHDLHRKIAELTRELEDKRKNWAPIKMKHPYVARDAGCLYCDDPAEDPRHAKSETAA